MLGQLFKIPGNVGSSRDTVPVLQCESQASSVEAVLRAPSRACRTERSRVRWTEGRLNKVHFQSRAASPTGTHGSQCRHTIASADSNKRVKNYEPGENPTLAPVPVDRMLALMPLIPKLSQVWKLVHGLRFPLAMISGTFHLFDSCDSLDHAAV